MAEPTKLKGVNRAGSSQWNLQLGGAETTYLFELKVGKPASSLPQGA